MSETQHITEQAMSPQCFGGQHEECKKTLSYILEDGIGRTMICPCRCHDRAPKSSTSEQAAHAYLISWEYEITQPAVGEETAARAWIKRSVLTTSKEMAGDWLDAITELMSTNQVRNLAVLKAELGKWEKVKSDG